MLTALLNIYSMQFMCPHRLLSLHHSFTDVVVTLLLNNDKVIMVFPHTVMKVKLHMVLQVCCEGSLLGTVGQLKAG